MWFGFTDEIPVIKKIYHRYRQHGKRHDRQHGNHDCFFIRQLSRPSAT